MDKNILALSDAIAKILKEMNPYIRIEITANEIKMTSTEASVPVEVDRD